MRGREFLMKDAYSFDLDFVGAKLAYQKMFLAYLRTFARMGLKAIPMRADSGAIGGDMSHEFIILAETGESAVFCHPDWLKLDPLQEKVSYEQKDLDPFFTRWTELYAATDEKHKPGAAGIPDDKLLTARGIEVGHIFYFGTKYSKPLGAVVTGPNGEPVTVEMGSYGIGVSRLMGGIIEASHDDNGIIWPEEVAPFKVGLINLKKGHEQAEKASDDSYIKLQKAGVDVLYDDRDGSAGVKFANMDLIGLPWHLVIGPRGIEKGLVEIKNRKSGEKQELSLESALTKLTQK
jgi:prolyl-tRNA synthetase